jgi:hypothetical protein
MSLVSELKTVFRWVLVLSLLVLSWAFYWLSLFIDTPRWALGGILVNALLMVFWATRLHGIVKRIVLALCVLLVMLGIPLALAERYPDSLYEALHST